MIISSWWTVAGYITLPHGDWIVKVTASTHIPPGLGSTVAEVEATPTLRSTGYDLIP